MDRTSIGRPRFIDDSPAMRPNVALVASDAPNATLGALDAPNATLGRSPRPPTTLRRRTLFGIVAVDDDVAHAARHGRGAYRDGLRVIPVGFVAQPVQY